VALSPEVDWPHGPMNMDDSSSSTNQADTVRLRVVYPVTVDLVRANDALTNLAWLGDVEPQPLEGGGWRVSTVLALPVVDGSAAGPIRKGVVLEVGRPIPEPDSISVDLGWQSDSLAPLFPVFAGQLELTEAGLSLAGEYAPPFGRLGLLIDRHLLHFIAERTAQTLLARLATHLAD
jgi:hypothetical protein